MAIRETQRKRYELQADVLKALAHPLRLAILEFLAAEEKCVCHIVEHVGTSQSNVSKHLSLMKKAGVLSDRKEGLSVYYRLSMPCALNFFQCVGEIIETRIRHHAEAIR